MQQLLNFSHKMCLECNIAKKGKTHTRTLTCMVDGKPKGQQVLQVCVLAHLSLCLQDLT